jgi:demethylmenaquinone methyltransferase/2-methoxy-6-polyprenyl-1,4-benzoquinol methylase
MDSAMRSYYEQRAPEYDDWWLGTGLFAQRDRPGWDEDVAALKAALAALSPARTLDVACGTGFLTEALPGELTGLDQSETMVEVASTRLPAAEFVVGDALDPPFADGAFERVHTAHFYGHLLGEQRARFLSAAARLAGELVVVDSALRPDGQPEAWQERTLNDGSRHRVYKRWFTATSLAEELGGGETVHAGPWFVAVRTARQSPRS